MNGQRTRATALAAALALWSASIQVASASEPPLRDELNTLAKEAALLPQGEPRFIQNFKQGLRAATYTSIRIAPSDPSVFYVASRDGYVFGTQNRGTTFSEGRLIVQRSRFYGSIRRAPIASGAPFSTAANISDLQSRGQLSFDIDTLLTYPMGTTSNNYLDVSMFDAQFYPSLVHPYLRDPSDIKLYDETTAGGGGGDLARLGVGLKTAAVYLAALLRKRHKRVLTMNLQLTLAVRGSEPTSISNLAVHPTRPNEVLAASHMGLWRSEDFGMSWVVAFPGATHKERTARHIVYRPDDPSQVFLSTDQGLRVSSDGGMSFEPIKGTQLSTARTQWIEWSISRPDTVYAGTTIGAFRSDDGGRTWRWIYFETLPTQNHVTSVALDPTNEDRVSLATLDGIFRSADGGETWERAGGLLFTGIKVRDLSANPNNSQHLICVTSRQVWETHDWGETWKAVYINDSEWWVREVRFDPHDRDVFWIITSNEVLRITPSREGLPPIGGLAAYRERQAVEPSLWETMEASYKNFGIHLGEHAEVRDRATAAAWMPRINVMGGILSGQSDAEIRFAIAGATDIDGQNDYLFNRTQTLNEVYAFLVLQWDLDRAVFDLDTVPYGRVFKTAAVHYRWLRAEVQRLYEERQRLLLELLTSPQRDLGSTLFLKLRLEELTAHLDAYTGGLWAPAAQWLATLE